MATRILYDSLLTSPSLAACSPRAQDAFPRLILLADDFGCFEASPRILLGRGWPLRPDVTEADVAGWLEEFGRARPPDDPDAIPMAVFWNEGGRRYGFLTGWFGERGQRRREEYSAANPKGSRRKTPPPPANLLERRSRAGNTDVPPEVPREPTGKRDFPPLQSQSHDQSHKHITAPSVLTAADAPSTSAFALQPTKPERPPRRRSSAEAFFDRCEDARLAAGIGGPRRHLQGRQVARWNTFYRDRMLSLGGDEERFIAVVTAYLADRWGLGLDPPCAWSGLTSADAWERCLAASERYGTGPPARRGPLDPAEAQWLRVLAEVARTREGMATQIRKLPLRAALNGLTLTLQSAEPETLPWLRETCGLLLMESAAQLNINLSLEDYRAETDPAHPEPEAENGHTGVSRATG